MLDPSSELSAADPADTEKWIKACCRSWVWKSHLIFIAPLNNPRKWTKSLTHQCQSKGPKSIEKPLFWTLCQAIRATMNIKRSVLFMLSFHDALSIAGAFCACPRYSPATMIAQLTSQCMYTYICIHTWVLLMVRGCPCSWQRNTRSRTAMRMASQPCLKMCLLHEQSERCLLYLPWTLSILVRQNSPEPQQAIVYASLRSMREKEGKFGHDHQYTIVYHSGSDRVRGICMIYAYICPICKADKDAGFCRP